MSDEPLDEAAPPYVSFGTLLNQIGRMEREGVPARIDPSYLVGMAGGTRRQFMVGLRSLGLVDENGQVTDVLIRLATSPDQRPDLLAGLLRSRFPSLVALNGSATRGQLEEVMAGYGLKNAETRRKAMTFYVAAATYAGITLSPHLRPAHGINASATATRPRSRPARKRSAAPARATAAMPRGADRAQMRQAYFDLLLNQAQQAADDKDLLDRIERLINEPGEDDNGGTP